jgi:hypothetical protein
LPEDKRHVAIPVHQKLDAIIAAPLERRRQLGDGADPS